jgi:hypothetical protein
MITFAPKVAKEIAVRYTAKNLAQCQRTNNFNNTVPYLAYAITSASNENDLVFE